MTQRLKKNFLIDGPIRRRGVIEVQFSWIFVIIAGAVFLILFLSIAKTQKNQTDSTINTELLQKLNSLILGSTSSFSSYKSISIPQVDLGVDCDENGLSTLSIGSGATIPTPVQAIYSRPNLNTNTLYIFTDSYATAYPVAPVLYLSAPTVRYVFINESASIDSTMERLHNLFPENVSEITTTSSADGLRQITDETVFISSGADNFCNPPSDFTPSKTLFVHITPDSGSTDDPTINSGLVEICKGGCTPTSLCTPLAYSGDAMLKGAIVSADPVRYACNTQKLIRRQVYLATLYDARTKLYIASNNLSSDCLTQYNLIESQLPLLLVQVNLTDPNTHTFINYATILNGMQSITSAIRSLSSFNAALIRGTKCPLLY